MIKNFTITTITAILLSGCGGGGSDETTAPVATPIPEAITLKLTVGNTTLDSGSHLSRVTSTITDSTKDVAIVKINKEGTITLSGEDSSLFELTDIEKGKQLSFVTKPDALSPMDSDQDGVYKIDINAQDNDGQSITYKTAYQILIPKTTLDILNGNSYYIDLGDNKYTKITYNDSSFTRESYINTELVEGSEETIAVTYQENSIQFVDAVNTTCVVNEASSLTLTCSAEGQTGEKKLTYLNTAPKFIIPASYSLSAIDANTNNHTDNFAPKIAKFMVTGNAPAENDKVIISKSKLGGTFSYSITMENSILAKQLQSGLMDGDSSILSDYSYNRQETINFDCIFNEKTDEGINYTCNSVSLQNKKGDSDTEMGMIVCDDKVNATDAKCSIATVPVSFID